MRLRDICTLMPFSEVEPGHLVALHAGDASLFCLTVGERSEEGTDILCLHPGHPGLGEGKAGVYDRQVVGARNVLVYPQAEIVPTRQIDRMMFHRQGHWPLSSLVLHDGEAFIIGGKGRNAVGAYGVATGRESQDVVYSNTGIAFRAWEAVVPVPGEAPYVLFSVNS